MALHTTDPDVRYAVLPPGSTLWHTLPPNEVLEAWHSGPEGLTGAEAERRLAHYGPNQFPTRAAPPLWEIFLRQFLSPLIYILLAAGVVSMLIGDLTDAIFIFIVILINAVLGAYQENRAEQSAAALRTLLTVTTRVRRDGRVQQRSAEDLVPGDVVLIESGDRVPADLYLLTATNLAVDEAFLTGESEAATKTAAITLAPETPVADRANLAYAGSTVTTGRAVGVVIATGTHTEIGKIAEATARGEEVKPPLVIRMVTNGIQHIALSFAAGEKGLMRRPPRRPEEGIFKRRMVEQVVLSGLTIGLIGFGVWIYLLDAGWEEEAARNLLLLLIVLFQNYHVFNCRSEYVSAFRMPFRNNPFAFVAVIAALGLHTLVMHVPFMQSLLRIAPVTLEQFLILAALAGAILVVMERYKLIRRETAPALKGSLAQPG